MFLVHIYLCIIIYIGINCIKAKLLKLIGLFVPLRHCWHLRKAPYWYNDILLQLCVLTSMEAAQLVYHAANILESSFLLLVHLTHFARTYNTTQQLYIASYYLVTEWEIICWWSIQRETKLPLIPEGNPPKPALKIHAFANGEHCHPV